MEVTAAVPVRTWVGRFSIVRGQAQEQGPWLGTFSRQCPDEEADELFVLVEPALAGSEEFCEQLVQAVGQVYCQDPLSITGALQRALKAAHERLRDWNDRSLPEHRVAAGATCLAVRDQVAYLAQAGPSLAFHFSEGGLRRLLPEDDAAQPLGLAKDFQPQLGRFELVSGDLLLMVSTRLDDLADEATVSRLLGRGADQVLPELYLLSRGQEEFSAVLLSCFTEPEQVPATPTLPPPAGPEQPSVAQECVGGEAEGTPGPPSAGVEGAEQPTVAGPEVDVSRPVVRLRDAQPSTRGRYPRTTGAAPALRIPREAILAVVILALVGLLAWCIIPGSVEESREDRFSDLLEGARASYTAAIPAQDPSQKRALLAEAEADLEEAATIHPDHGEMNALRAEVSQALAELDAVYELADLTLVTNLTEQVTGSLSIGQLAVGALGAYFLDLEGGRVVALPLVEPAAEPFVVLQEGDVVGLARVGRPTHIVWAQGLTSLLILDGERQLFAYQPAEGVGRPLSIRGAHEWGSVDALAYVGGNLYVLDLEANQVWRYLPTEGGFDSERSGLLSGVDLEGAVGLAVSGDLFILMEDGQVRRFEDGQERPFPLAGIDQALLSPASLVTLPTSGRLMVADRGNKRLVALSADGTFLRQMVSPQFTDLRALAADEPAALLYVLVGDSLYRAALPP